MDAQRILFGRSFSDDERAFPFGGPSLVSRLGVDPMLHVLHQSSEIMCAQSRGLLGAAEILMPFAGRIVAAVILADVRCRMLNVMTRLLHENFGYLENSKSTFDIAMAHRRSKTWNEVVI